MNLAIWQNQQRRFKKADTLPLKQFCLPKVDKLCLSPQNLRLRMNLKCRIWCLHVSGLGGAPLNLSNSKL